MALINLFDLYAKISLDSSEYDEGLNKASSNTSSFASKLKKGLATAAKAGAAALGAAATGVAALTKASLDQYAEYEQLVGGIKTLFKDSSDTVQQYAANAYKTAGVSANSYMEQATAFSASLIQSLGGDTEAAAEYANQAIMDMSDNANKMGTDIESIQQTYQSLMRGNYAMLDNLKLGYGGTKAELERLVAKAEELTGQALDPSKFSDVITAIHAVQENLGITGATAEEASTTIQGSLNMMQSAWSNLVAGIGNENANMTSLIDNFVESAATVGENILPRIQQIFTGIGTLVQQLAPIIAEAIPGILSGVLPGLMNAASTLFMTLAASLPSLLQTLIPAVTSFITTNLPQLVTVAFQIMTTLVNGLIQALPQLAAAIPQIITAITTSLATAGPQLLQSGVQLLQQLATGIQNGLPQLAAVLPQIISNFINFITANLPQILQQGVQIINSLVNGILNAIPELVANLPQVITSIVNFIVSSLPQILEAGVQILQNLITGIINTIPELVSNLPQIINAIVNGIGSLMGSIINIGGDIVRGIWDGISGAAGWLWSQITGWMSGIVNGIKGFFGIGSPSKLMRDEVGKWLPSGLGQGISKNAKAAVSAANRMGQAVFDATQQWVDRENSLMNGFGTPNLDFGGYQSPTVAVRKSGVMQDLFRAGGGDTIVQNIHAVPLTPSELARQSVDAYRRLRWA